MPQPPAILTSPEQKAEFVATHYWYNFAFADTRFYEHIGFEVFKRTEFDEQGNPFPILKMKLRQ